MKLRHIHFPGLTPYVNASRIQDALVARQLAYKSAIASSSSSIPPLAQSLSKQQPPPTVLTFEFPPTYTAGLRSIDRLSDAEIAYLQADGKAHFAYASRGGQTTFHGPGQLVAYPVIDLRRHSLSARCYVDMLERAVIGTCGAFGVRANKTENVGVWVPSSGQRVEGQHGEPGVDGERKICAVGVHLRRHISSHGIGLNVSTDLAWFDRIVACGLEGKRSTSLAEEGVAGVDVEQVGKVFVDHLARLLKGVQEVEFVKSSGDAHVES